MGPLNDADEEGSDRAPGRHQVRHHLDDARRVSRLPRRSAASRRTSPRSSARRRCASTSSATTNRAPTPTSSSACARCVRQAMEEGALGVGSALIYAPAFYAKTDELIALAKAAAEYGRHVHLAHAQRRQPPARSDRRADHDRARGARSAPRSITSRRPASRTGRSSTRRSRRSRRRAKTGLEITADMYTYTAGATGLDAAMPPWVQEGGYKAWAERLQDPTVRERVRTRDDDADRRVGEPAARRLAGEDAAGRLQERRAQAAHRQDARRSREAARQVAGGDGDGSRHRGRQPRAGTVYFLMSEENVQASRSRCRG